MAFHSLPQVYLTVSSPLPLSAREREIATLVGEGLSNKQIARQLNLSEGTVKNYLTEIFRLLQVSNRTQAARSDIDCP